MDRRRRGAVPHAGGSARLRRPHARAEPGSRVSGARSSRVSGTGFSRTGLPGADWYAAGNILQIGEPVTTDPSQRLAGLAFPNPIAGGTSLLIVVNVTMDFVGQVQSHLFAHQYEGLIKKAKLKGRLK